eukprot:Tamp_23256.p1 GENE.Tamp_23256~~Tamp_23256.p1  ORF type:complete len:100 (+),score=2.48 Tamp_23256:546-845(+)
MGPAVINNNNNNVTDDVQTQVVVFPGSNSQDMTCASAIIKVVPFRCPRRRLSTAYSSYLMTVDQRCTNKQLSRTRKYRAVLTFDFSCVHMTGQFSTASD